MDRLKAIITSPRTEKFITALIVVNAVTLGLETSAWAMANFGPILVALDRAILAVFVLEIVARIAVHRLAFFKDPWSLFDFAIVAIALVPATGAFSVLRALRILRVLRMVTLVPSLKRVVGALISALPGMGSIILLMTLIFVLCNLTVDVLYAWLDPRIRLGGETAR